MAGKGGGAWKVAYADFVTAMMAFFLVMWITAQNTKMKQAVAHYFNNPSQTTRKPTNSRTFQPYPLDSPRSQRNKLKGEKKGRGAPEVVTTLDGNDRQGFAEHPPTLFVLHDGKRSITGSLVSFAEDSADLDQAAEGRLQTLLPLILGKPNKLEIRGHTTGRPIPGNGPYQDAWHLAYARCQAVMRFLIQHGIEPERLRLSQAGPFERMSLEIDDSAKTPNGRVEIYMLSEFVEELQGTSAQRAARAQLPWDEDPSSTEAESSTSRAGD